MSTKLVIYVAKDIGPDRVVYLTTDDKIGRKAFKDFSRGLRCPEVHKHIVEFYDPRILIGEA